MDTVVLKKMTLLFVSLSAYSLAAMDDVSHQDLIDKIIGEQKAVAVNLRESFDAAFVRLEAANGVMPKDVRTVAQKLAKKAAKKAQ